jgi:hypothetical protein|nr:MAG TPA: hypothetical protein [Caudoviricetes sp.]
MLHNQSTDVTTFNSAQFGDLRTHQTESGSIWFCLSDVANALGLEQVSRLKSRLNERGVTTIKTPTYNQHGALVMQDLNFIDEPNLYRCIFQSRKAEAEQFQNWVFEEVLPSIRKNGGYVVTTQEDTPELIMARALQVAQATITKHEQMLEQANERISIQDSQIQKLQPKADFADAAFKAEGNVDIGQAAKILGLPFGRNTLFKKLREKGVFFGNRNEPKQRFIDAGYFKLTELPPIKRENHTDLIVMKCICTQKGLAYINMLFGGSFSKPTLTTIK